MRSWFALGLFVAIAAAPTAARANNDVVQFFSDIHVTPDTPVHDAVCLFCSVQVEGTVNHDIVVLFGSIDISGSARHDVVSVFGSVNIHDNASIEHDLVSVFGSLQLGRECERRARCGGRLRLHAGSRVGQYRRQPRFHSGDPLLGAAGRPRSPHCADRVHGPRAQPPLAAARISSAACAVDSGPRH